ncbi:MAG: EamA family transporter [Crocinitomicaceae bacterium]|nr:EamA family transporter [Crocinitomicaceae bacterium]
MEILKAHFALFAVNLIYGANYVIAKKIMPTYVEANAMIFLRVVGAATLFWILFAFRYEKIAKKDMLLLATCGLFGVAVNQLFFFNGLQLTSSINSAIIMSTNPIITVILALFILKEKVTWNRALGILVGGTGAILFIMNNSTESISGDSVSGDIFIFINAASYALYLVLAKPLMKKYKPLTVITWVFTFGLIYVSLFPLTFKEMSYVKWDFPTEIWWRITFVIIAVTFLAYLLNIYALKRVSPAISSSYIYLQPVLATLFLFLFSWWGMEDYTNSITFTKVLCTIAILAGVFLISLKTKKG